MKYECWQCGKLTDNGCEICDDCLKEWEKDKELMNEDDF